MQSSCVAYLWLRARTSISPYVIAPRRPGDPDEVYANAEKAKKLLGWEAKKDVDDMCRDSWNWQSNNPNGYNE